MLEMTVSGVFFGLEKIAETNRNKSDTATRKAFGWMLGYP